MKIRHILIAAALAIMPAVAVAQDGGTRAVAAPALAASLTVREGSGVLTGFNVTTGATAGYIMVFDATVVPPDGAVTPLRCLPIAPNVGIEQSYRTPIRFYRGAILVFSTSGCYAKTASATAFLAGDAQ